MMGIVMPETFEKNNKICNKNLCCIYLAFYFHILTMMQVKTTSNLPGKYWKVLLEKDGEYQLDRPYEMKKCCVGHGGREDPVHSRGRKVDWIGHILWRNCLLKHITMRKMEGRIEVTGRRWKRRKQLSNDLKETREYLKLKEVALHHTLWQMT